MKFLRRMLLLVMVSSFFMSTITSCKKGEDDPFLSFRSRKQRLVGEWALEEGVARIGNYVINYNGTSATFGTESWAYTEIHKFGEGGEYECTITSDKQGECCKKSGTWTFGARDANLDLKNKEYVVIKLQEYTYYGQDSSGNLIEVKELYDYDACPLEMLRFKELRKKEITIEADGNMSQYYGNYAVTNVESYKKRFKRN